MAQPYLSPNGVYYIRRKVPEALRKPLGREYKRSLETRDPNEAKRRFALEWEKSEQLMARARAQKAGASTLSNRDMRILAGRWYDEELSKMEASGDYSPWLATGDTVIVGNDSNWCEHTHMTTLGEAVNDCPEDEAKIGTSDIVRSALMAHNIPMPSRDGAEFEILVGLFKAQWLRLSDTALSRYKGNWAVSKSLMGGEVLSYESKAAPVVIEKRLQATFEEYAQDRLLTDGDTRAVQRSIKAFRSLVDEFVELCSDLPLKQITREVIRSYRADIASMPSKGDGIRALNARQKIETAKANGWPLIEAPTIRNKLRGISAVLSYALRMQLISENPIIAGGIGGAAAKAASKGKNGRALRNYYDQPELLKIFSSPIFSIEGWVPPRVDFGKAWYWLPLLMYYTGARREELAQLKVSDIVINSKEVGPFLRILNAEGEEDGKRGVKNESSRRSIPLHADLIDRGFLDYVSLQPQDGQLFPKLKPNPAGYYGANFGKRWSDYLRTQVGLNSPANPSHGFRHTFKTLCRAVSIPEDVHDAITGHAGSGSVARDYGEMPLSRMKQELKKYPKAPF